MKIDAVFFDMGGTIDLYPLTKSGRIASCAKMKQMLEEAGAQQIKGLSDEEFFQIILNGIKSYKNWRTDEEIELSPERFFSEFVFAGMGIDEKIINDLGESMALLISIGFRKRVARPEAGEVFEAIRSRGIRQGIISNVISRTQVEVNLKEYGFFEYFDPIVLSSVFGRRKPNPAIFHHAFEKMGVDPANVIFVGNSPSRDIVGGRNAGVGKVVCIEYADTPLDEQGAAVGDYQIKDLRELIGIIDNLRND